jgi:hypothetical protein
LKPHLFEHEQPFCENPACRLHVQVGEAGVEGAGNWAEVDGFLVGRGRYGGQMLCDLCGRATVVATVEEPQRRSQEA